MKTWNVTARAIALLCMFAVAQPSLAASCAMSTQMANAQAQEQKRRQDLVNNNLQQLQLLNQLEQACVENFPDINTQGMVGGPVVTEILKQVRKSVCKGLADKARQTSDAALASARQAAQKAIDDLERGVTSNIPGGSSTTGLLGGALNQAGVQAPSTTGIIDQVTGGFARLFQ